MPMSKPSLPKGTRDFLPEQMVRRQFVFNTVTEIFEKYGYEPLETPSIEKLDVLSGKYGDEGEKLIFKVLRRGTGLEELLWGLDEFVVKKYNQLVDEALRYDLTVPLSRVVAMYQNELNFPFKRYQIQPVWRADRPQRGRYREFYQCDVDTIGTESMLADAETIAIVNEVLSSLGFEKFRIRINNRKILNGILEYASIKPSKSFSVFIAIDKLEKIGLDGVKKELKEKGLSTEEANKILTVLEVSDQPEEILSYLSSSFDEIDSMREGTQELAELISYLEVLGVPKDRLTIDLYLVRGLGYYTGPIYESVVQEPRIGSLTGGGRYDQLIGIFLGRNIPATGTSFGIERIISVMTQLEMFPKIKTKTQILVTMFDKTTQTSSLSFTQELRNAGLKTESYLGLTRLKRQYSYANKKQIPFVVTIGPDEQAENKVTIKNMQTGEQNSISREGAIEYLKNQCLA